MSDILLLHTRLTTTNENNTKSLKKLTKQLNTKVENVQSLLNKKNAQYAIDTKLHDFEQKINSLLDTKLNKFDNKINK